MKRAFQVAGILTGPLWAGILTGPLWAGILTGLLLAGPWLTGHAAARDSKAKGALTRPAAERRVEAGVDKGRMKRLDSRSQQRAEQPTNEFEGRHYFRDASDKLTDRARAREAELIDKLLKEREEQVLQRRKEAIALLERFVDSEPEQAAEMADALLRLSELHWERSREKFLADFATWQKTPPKLRSRTPPVPDYRSAMKLYDRLLEKHPDFARLDLVLYMKAFAFMERGQQSEALELYERILRDFPDSEFRPDAHMAKAEYTFSVLVDYRAALREYNKVLEYDHTELYDLALFKSAWCLWRMDRKKDASVRFRRVLDLDGVRARGDRRKRIRELQDEALEYLIQVFTEDERNRAADVQRFLQEIGGERHVQRVLRRLSATYYSQARFARGVEAYALLLSLDPAAPQAPDYQLAIARGYMALTRFDDAVAAYRALCEGYKKGSTWGAQQPDPDAQTEADARIEEAVRTQGLSLHQLAQGDDDTDTFRQAASIYELYLDHFASHKEGYKIRFYQAEILFHRLKEYGKAGDAYLAAARANKKGEFTRDALYNAIGAFERVREGELDTCKPNPGKGITVCPETDNDKKFSSAIELYAELYPKDPDLPEILFRQGKLYYERRVYDSAVRLLGQLLDLYPTSEYASSAGELILDSFNRAQDFANIERWARQLKDAPAFASAASQKRLNGLILGAVFKIGEQLAEKGEHAEAADAYVRAAEEFPKDERAPKALYNAGKERQRAGDLEGADATYTKLIERYPGTDEGALGAWNGAQMFESIAQFSDAARFYEAYDKSFPRGDKAADALYNAVLLRVTAGEDSRAAENGKRFLSRFGRDASADDVHFLIGRAQAHANDHKQAASTYRRYTKRAKNLDRKVEAFTRLGQVLLETGNKKAADRALSSAVKLGRKQRRRLEDGLNFAAQARYLQGDQALAEFDAVKIGGELSGLKKRLQKKAKLLGRAATIYADVVDFQVAQWVTAALFKVGRIYELFAKALNDAPIPEGLNEEEQQVYRDELAMFVVPIEERALEAYEGGYRKALELRIYNRWTSKLREGLTRLNDVEYPPIRELGGDIEQVTVLPRGKVVEGLRREQDQPEATP